MPRVRPMAPWLLLGLALGAAGLFWVVVRRPGPATPARPAVPDDHPRPGAQAVLADRGTERMVERLRRLAAEADPEASPYLNALRAERFRRRLETVPSAPAKLELQIRLSLELLRAGDSEAAIATLLDARTLAAALPPGDRPEAIDWLLPQFLGVAHLRLGEQDNCVARHSSRSCLFPIGRQGVHAEKRGARGAVRFLSEALRVNPHDLGSLWLLNIAYMTLGEYPDAVPARWRIPVDRFASEAAFARFDDVAPAAGLAADGLSGGVCLEDFDGDLLLDVVCSSWGLGDQIRFFRNRGDGGFEERTEAAGLRGLTGGLNLCHADYDNDGDVDILVLRGAWLGAAGGHPNSLLRNDGGARFADVTEAAGLLSFHPTQTAAWGDYNGDGWLDVFIGNESEEEAGVVHPCELYHNNGDGTFTECAAAAGLDHVGFVKGVVWGDIDNDGREDLYLSRLGETNVLFHNRGPRRHVAGPRAAARPGRAPAAAVVPWTFADVSAAAAVTEPIRSFPTWFWDYDNDGWLDLFVAPYSWEATTALVAADCLGVENPGETPRLYRNQGDGTFRDVTAPAGLRRVVIAMGANYGDLDSDGFADFYLGTGEPDLSALMPNRMFRGRRGDSFEDVTTAGGFGHLQKGHGIAFGDVDNDGDQDVYAVLGGAYEGDTFVNALFENPGNANRWLALLLEGRSSNRSAIGVRVVATVAGAGGVRRVCGRVSTGGSFGSAPLRVHLGLGAAALVESLEVTWPAGGSVQRFEDVPLDSFLRIAEGEPEPVRLMPPRFALAGR